MCLLSNYAKKMERLAIYKRLKEAVAFGSVFKVLHLLIYADIGDIHGYFCKVLSADDSVHCVSCDALLRPALRQRHTDMIKLLLEHGAYPPTEICTSTEDRYCRRKNPSAPLKLAVESGCSIADVSELLSSGADVNLRPRSICVKRRLIRRDFECTDCDTPLMAAVRRRDVAMIRFLMAHGARVSAGVYTDDKGGISKTALALATAISDEHLITELVTCGADVNQSLGPRGTLLHHYRDNVKIVKLLVGLGADPNARDATGDSVFLKVLVTCDEYRTCRSRSDKILQSLRLMLPTTRKLDHYILSNRACHWIRQECSILMLQHGARIDYNHVFCDEYSGYLTFVQTKPTQHSERFIELLRAADTNFSGVRQRIASVDKDDWEPLNLAVLDQKLSQPLTLQASCVISVRRQLLCVSDVGMWARIEKLPLPTIIKDRLKLIVW